MTTESLKQFEELSPRISKWYAQMYEIRQWLLHMIGDLSTEEIDFTPNKRTVESIGTLLIHIAGVEWSWIFEDIDGLEMDFEKFKHGFALRSNVNIQQIKGNTIQFYITLLNEVREQVYQRLQSMTDADLEKTVEEGDKKFSIDWIFFHLVEHEAMHVGQISLLKRLYKSQI